MSVSTTVNEGRSGGSPVKLSLGLLFLIAAGVALAWLGAGALRGSSLPSGVTIRTVQKGEGEYVKPIDGVLIDYEGRLENGTVFDTSEGRGPAPLIAGQVIPGFSEALTKMQKGGRYVVKIPGKLAYGASPPPGSPIPPNAALEFDVHVIQVVPNAALMQGGGAQPPQGELPPGQ
jgi:FKBP-type peptidyl-prolyl cis-trans isomerase FkpA